MARLMATATSLIPKDLINKVMVAARNAATSPDGRIDRALERKSGQEGIYDLLNTRGANVVAMAEAMAHDTAMAYTRANRKANKLKFDKKTGLPIFKEGAIITVGENEDVLVVKAKVQDWVSAYELIQTNLGRQLTAAARFGTFVASLPALYTMYGTMESIIEEEYVVTEDDSEGEAYDGDST